MLLIFCIYAIDISILLLESKVINHISGSGTTKFLKLFYAVSLHGFFLHCWILSQFEPALLRRNGAHGSSDCNFGLWNCLEYEQSKLLPYLWCLHSTSSVVPLLLLLQWHSYLHDVLKSLQFARV